MPTIEVDLRRAPAYLARGLFGAILVLSVGHLVAIGLIEWVGVSDEFALVSLVHLDQEQNVPTFFSTMLLLFCGGCVLALGSQINAERLRLEPLSVLVASVFLFLAVDEFASIHERVAGTINSQLGEQSTIPHIWLVPYAILAIPVGAVMLLWMSKLPRRTQISLVLSLGIAVAGGFGMETIAAVLHVFAPSLMDASLLEIALSTIEEVLEMIGFSAFGLILLSEYLRRADDRRLYKSNLQADERG